MDKTQYIAIATSVLYILEIIIGANPRWKSNNTIQAAVSVINILWAMFTGKKVEVIPDDLQKEGSRSE